MDWFPYDRDLRLESVNVNNTDSRLNADKKTFLISDNHELFLWIFVKFSFIFLTKYGAPKRF